MEFIFNIYPRPNKVQEISMEIDNYSSKEDKIMFKFSRFYYDSSIKTHVIEVKVRTNISDIKYIMEMIYMFGAHISSQMYLKEKIHSVVRDMINIQSLN